jgi:hypothetical protein
MAKDKLTNEDWAVIRDALEMRHSECISLSKEMECIGSRMTTTFKTIAEKAEKTLAKLDELDLG